MNAMGIGVHAADQRLVRERRPAAASTGDLRRRHHARPGRGRGLGRLGPVLHADVPPARRPRTARRSRCATRRGTRAAACPGSTTLPAWPARRRGRRSTRSSRRRSLFDIAQPARPASGTSSRSTAAASTNAPRPACCPRAVRRREQLDARVPEGVRDPARRQDSAATPRRTGSSSGCSTTASRSAAEQGDYATAAQTFEQGLIRRLR